jgi:hypothetical protein
MSAPSDRKNSERERFKAAIIQALKEKGGPMTAKEIGETVKDLLGLDRPYNRTGYYLTELVRDKDIRRKGRGIYELPT